MSRNATIGTVIAIVVILVGFAVYYQSTQDKARSAASETSSVTVTNGTNGSASTVGGTVVGGTSANSAVKTGTTTPKTNTGSTTSATTSPAVSVGTPGYVDYTMKAGESINIAGYTATLTSIGATDVSVKLVKGPTTSNQTYKLNAPSTGYGFTGEIRSINTTNKSVVFRVTILP